jgi:hypothetical protein
VRRCYACFMPECRLYSPNHDHFPEMNADIPPTSGNAA